MADAPTAPQNPRDYADLLEMNNSDAFAFSEREKVALDLYDQLKELELQRSLLEAQNEGILIVHECEDFCLTVSSGYN